MRKAGAISHSQFRYLSCDPGALRLPGLRWLVIAVRCTPLILQGLGMDPQFFEQFCPRDRLKVSAELSPALWRHFRQDSTCSRKIISNSAISFAHELHAAILHLIGLYNFAAATVLLRPIMEAATTAGWALYALNEERASSIIRMKSNIPKHSRMLDELEKSKAKSFGLKEMMRGDARIFHAMTHGGSEQLRRRHSHPGSTYSLEENYLTLSLADIFLLLAFSIHGATFQDEQLDSLLAMATDKTMLDTTSRFTGNQPVKWPGWSRLPDPEL